MATPVECAMCDTTFDPEANAGSCPNCGVPDPGYTQNTGDDGSGGGGDDNAGGGGSEEADKIECPHCGHQVNEEANYCTNCSEALNGGDLKPAVPCPDCGETIPEGADFCMNCGTKRTDISDDDSDSDSEETESAPSMNLVIGSSEHEIVDDGNVVVEDGSFGLEARRDAIDQGESESDALTISREHLLFKVDNGDIVVTENGRNDTTLNGEELNDGEKRTLSDGDQISLNGVVTATVEIN